MVSGLLVAAVVKASNSGVADGVVILWFALATVGAGVLAGIVARRRRRSARVFLLTSAFSQKYFLADFVQRVHLVLDRKNIDLVLKVPEDDYDAEAQSHNLQRIEARKREYLGGIVIAAEMDLLRRDLTEFCRETKLPVVFTDLEPFEQPDDYPENAAFVGYDTGELGKQAGDWLVRQLRSVDHPRVLIIASEDHSARQERCSKPPTRNRPGSIRCGETTGRSMATGIRRVRK